MGRPKSPQVEDFPDPDLPLAIEASNVPRNDRDRFRELAEHKELVEKLVSEGVTKRAKILREIACTENGGPAPKVTGTRIVIEVEIDGDKETAREVLVEMLESLTERFDLLSCSRKVGRASE